MKPHILVLALVLVGGSAALADAQSSPTTVRYTAGWNMLGIYDAGHFSAPPTAEYLYDMGQYARYTPVPAALSRSAPCAGGWGYFPGASAASAFTPEVGQANGSPLAAYDCPLARGWNMLADPFGGRTAVLPQGAAAFYWDAHREAYRTVGTIPLGGSAWVFTQSDTFIRLVAAS